MCYVLYNISPKVFNCAKDIKELSELTAKKTIGSCHKDKSATVKVSPTMAFC